MIGRTVDAVNPDSLFQSHKQYPNRLVRNLRVALMPLLRDYWQDAVLLEMRTVGIPC